MDFSDDIKGSVSAALTTIFSTGSLYHSGLHTSALMQQRQTTKDANSCLAAVYAHKDCVTMLLYTGLHPLHPWHVKEPLAAVAVQLVDTRCHTSKVVIKYIHHETPGKSLAAGGFKVTGVVIDT